MRLQRRVCGFRLLEADFHWRLYQMIPIRGEMFVTDTSMCRSIIAFWRSVFSADAAMGAYVGRSDRVNDDFKWLHASSS